MNYKEAKTHALILANSTGVNHVIVLNENKYLVYPEKLHPENNLELVKVEVKKAKVKKNAVE